MADIAQLTVALYANSAQFVSEMTRSRRVASQWSTQVKTIFAQAATGMAVGATAAAGAIALIYREQAKVIDQTAKISDQLGITTEAYTRLKYAANITGAAEQFDTAMQYMTVKLGETSLGIGEAEEAVHLLGLQYEKLGRMKPEDQFIAISDALQKVESQSQRLFIVDEIFGNPEMINMLNKGPDGLRKMAEEADILGITLNRLDAAKVEAANLAMHRAQQVGSAFAKSLTTELSPIVMGLADAMFEQAKQAGSMNDMIANGIKSTLDGIGFLMDAWHSVSLTLNTTSVAYEMLFHGIKVGIQTVANIVQKMGIEILKGITYPILKGLEAVSGMSDVAADAAEQIRSLSNLKPLTIFDDKALMDSRIELTDSIHQLRTLASEEMPSDKIDAWYANAKTKIDELAKARVADIHVNKTDDTLLKDPKSEGERTGALESFKTESAEIQKEWVRRLQMRVNHDQAAKLQEEFAHQDRLVSLSKQFQAAFAAASANQQLQTELELQYFAVREALYQEHQANLTDIEKEAAEARLQMQAQEFANYSSLFGNIADITKAFAGEQSGIYKAMFAASKAFAIAESVIKIQQGIAQAAALPYPQNLPAMASVASATAGIISTISGTNIQGMAHNGISEVPSEGTWLLDKGERVYTNESAQKLDSMYGAIMNGKGGGGKGVTVNQQVSFNLSGGQANDPDTLKQISNMVRQVTMETIINEQRPGGRLYG